MQGSSQRRMHSSDTDHDGSAYRFRSPRSQNEKHISRSCSCGEIPFECFPPNAHAHPRWASVRTKSAPSLPPADGCSVLLALSLDLPHRPQTPGHDLSLYTCRFVREQPTSALRERATLLHEPMTFPTSCPPHGQPQSL